MCFKTSSAFQKRVMHEVLQIGESCNLRDSLPLKSGDMFQLQIFLQYSSEGRRSKVPSTNSKCTVKKKESFKTRL